jgi:sugar lactone lactonase YvrE
MGDQDEAAGFRTVFAGGHFLEGPRWHEDRIWFSDFYGLLVRSAREDGSDLRTEAEVPGQPSGTGWLPDGRMLVASMTDRRVLRREDDGTLVVHADLAEHATGHVNDMIVDDQGRAYVGNFGFDLMSGDDPAPASLHRVDPDGTVTEVAGDLMFPNGMAFLPDGSLLVAETWGNRLTAFDVADDGSLGNRRVWAGFADPPEQGSLEEMLAALVVASDGISTVDPRGGVWVADATHGRAIRVVEGGEITDERSPGTGVFACTVGGKDGHTLFLCTAPDFLEEARTAATEGVLLATSVD